MKNQHKAFHISTGLHILIVAMLISIGSWITPQRHFVKIDLTLENDDRRVEAPPPVRRETVPEKMLPPVKQETLKSAPVVHEVQADKQAPLPEPVIQRQAPVNVAPVMNTPPASPAKPIVSQGAKTGYTKERFSYIQALIQKKAIYPVIAMQRSWEGKVVLSFQILSDGAVQNIKVIESSGRAILDQSAIEAVKSAAPFPKPPMEVELKIPVAYKLLDGE